MSESDHALAEILEWFSDLEAAIPGVRSTVGEILIGKIPESDIDAVYELSDAWGAATEELAAFYQEAVHAADGILENWSGDGAAEVFTREWLSYLQSLAGTVDTLASMEEAVQSFGLQIELMKFMALIGLIMLAVSLFMLVAAAIPSLGLSTAGIPGAFAACRAAIGAAATNAVRAIGSISVRAALAEVTALLTRTLPTLVRTQLPALVRTQVPRLVTTQLPRFARTQVPAFVRQTLPTLARQGAGNLARGVLPRNVVARSVADRMAGQWLRGVTNRELLRQLGREAGLESRRLAGRSLLAARNQLAREIEEQLLRRFGARVGTDLAARGGVRLAGTEAFEQLSRATLSQYAAREIATTTFGRELTKYLGQRVAFGTAFMGGGNLLGQMYQIAGGERAGLDLGQLGMSTVQGGIFGASMFGGMPGHIVGGGLAGGLVTGVTDAAQGRFDVQNMLHGGAEGAKAGGIFGAQNRLDAVRVGGMDLRIGRDVMVLPEGMAAVDRAAGLRVTYSERGAVWAHVDGDGQRLDGGAIAADGSVLARDGVRSPDPTVVDGDVTSSGGPRTTPPPLAALPPADLPQRTGPIGGTGGGDGGGGPRQPAHPTPVRTPEAGVRTIDPVRPPADPVRPPADPVRPGGERPPGELVRPDGDRAAREPALPSGERTGGEPATRATTADTAPQRTGGPAEGGPGRSDVPPAGRDVDSVHPDVEPGRRDVEPARGDVEPGSRDVEPGGHGPQGQLPVVPAEGHVPFELVPAGSHPIGPSVPLPEAVRATFDGHIGELLAGRDAGPADQPHLATWDESSRLLTVGYPDGLTVRVAVQVNSALPPGQPVVLRPGMAVEHGQWVQREPAGVVLPDHLPADPAARTAFVDRQLGEAWRTLHREIHQVLDRPVEAGHPAGPGRPVEEGRAIGTGHPAGPGRAAEPERTAEAAGPVGSGRAGVPVDGVPEAGRDAVATPDGPTRPAPARAEPEPSLAALEQPGRPDPPVLDVDAVGFRDATAPPPVPPRPLTPDTVRGLLTGDPAAPGPLRDWAREHLAERQEDGSYLPRSQAEIDAVVARLRAETTALVTPRTPADPNAVPPAAPKPADPPAATLRPADPDATTLRPVDPDVVPPRHVDPEAVEPGAVDPVVPAESGRAGDGLPISQELAPSSNFPAHRTRTGAELPEQVHELVGRAKENLLARYPEAAVAARLADLDAVGRQADRLQLAADRARDGGPLGDVVREVRELSRAVDGYADRYRDWRDFSRGGEHADPGWRDLDGVDPLNSVEMAHRVVSVDPVTHRFHVIDQAIAVAKIGDVLGPAFERHAAGTFDRVIPKDPDSARALVPAEAYTPALEQWIAQGARGGFDSRHGLTFIAAEDGGQPRPISALAATVLHEGMHRLQPNPDHIGSHLIEAVAEGRLPRAARDAALVGLRFEGEFQAFTVQQQFLRGLAGFRSTDHASDPRLPRSDGYRSLADLTPRQLQEYVTSRYVAPASRSTLSPDILRRLAELPPESFVERARQAIEEATHPLAEQRRQGTLHGPMSRDVAERFGLDLDVLGREQAGRVEPPLRDRGGPAPTVPPDPAGPPPLAEWGPGGPVNRPGFRPSDPVPERPRGGLRRVVDRVAAVFRVPEEPPPSPEAGGLPRGDDRQGAPAGLPEPTDRQPSGEPRRWASDGPRSPWEAAGEVGPARGGPRPPAPAVDAATLLRTEERRYALEELRAATDPIDQARLRAELDRFDADLARRGYPVHQLAPVPEAPRPQDGPYVDGRDHSRHDELWTDRRWRQEDRRPSLDELIPSSDEEVAAWSDVVRAEVAAQLDGREFAGLRIRLDLADEYSISVHRDQVTVRADIVDPERGSVGRVVRVFQRDHDGSLFVEHTSLRLSDAVQGRGFAREWNEHLENWYRESGVERIEIHAASTVGGYAWARAGYDWAPDTAHRASAVLGRLRVELRAVDADIAEAGRWAAGDPSADVARLRERYGNADPAAVLTEANRQREAGREILDRARTHSFGSTWYPTPFEISQAGWGDQHQGRDASWIGKRALLGADWKGVKRISDTGPLHPRSAYTAGLPRVPDPSAIHSLLSGGGPAPVTAARVPDAGFHGYGREVPEPELVRQLGADALRQVVDGLPADSTLRGVRLELTTVPADALPDGAVARSVPTDAHGRDLPYGTVAPEGGGWRVELSDRATDVNVARAVAHEAAELEAIGQRAAGGLDPFTPDALTPAVPADHTGLSPHDLGRLAEVEVLADLLRDPAQAAYARTELRALRDHLGLHPDDPGAAARLRLLDGRLSDTGRDALLGPPGEQSRPPADGEPGHARDEGSPGRTSDGAGLPGRARDDGTALVGRDGDGPGAVRPDAVDPAAPTRADLAAATYPARVSRVPFEFERFLHDPRWSDGATRFEQRLGAHYFRDPEVLDTVRTALTRMRDILVELTDPRHPGETRAEVVARVESAFFRDDEPASAGQVGTSVSFDRLLAEGNLRETMTAFYNAAYCNWKNPHTLSHTLLSVLDGGRWEQAQGAGVDVGAVRRMGGLLDGTVNRLMPDALRDRLKFGRDFFATGNVARSSAHGIRDLTEMTASQSPRRPRSDEEQLALANTPDHYARLGTPLGRLERAYVDQLNREKTGDPLGDHGLLPWREGATAHDTDHGPWARWVGRDGFPVIDGVSGTTARMLTAARFVGLDGPQAERFLSGLMGWMLPARDHSLFEILRGAEIAGIQRVELRPSDGRFTAVDLYRSLPDVDLPTLRAEVAVDGLFPHEARYLDHAVDPHGFSETQHKVPAIADRLWPQLADGQVRDADLADWLRRNGIDPADTAAVRDLGQRLSKPHVMALAVYTRHSHYLINNVIRAHLFTGAAGEVPSRALFDRKVRELVAGYLGNLAAGSKALPLPLMLRSVVHVGDGHLTARSELAGPARDWVDAHRRVVDAQRRIDEHHRLGQRHDERQARADKQRAKRDAATSWKQIRRGLDAVSPRLFDEVVWHADMVHDAMMQLPAVGRPERPLIAFRGDWITPIHSPIYGSSWHPTAMAREFLSVSRRLDVAVRFMSENPASGGKVLVVYRLSGQQARDIAVFSSFATDEEAVFPPRSRVRRTSDPQLAAQIRAQLPAEFQDNCEIIVMEED
ncbi:hypothetical protein ABZ436_04165 [Micromonospora matsumotoense]|uniref:WXG100-like domain-containing protein n=1 Tax=Micromonospora matsumotoense TaxID=121616 RepID=UPI0033C64256